LFLVALPYEDCGDGLLVFEERSNTFLVDNCCVGFSVIEYCSDGLVVVEDCSNRLLAEKCCVGLLVLEYCSDGLVVTEDCISRLLLAENCRFVVLISVGVSLPLKLWLLHAATSANKVCNTYKYLK
jgi:hypothetical protein